jgi:hypothetical protein
MLNRRGLMGAGAVLAAGSVIADSFYDWLSGDAALAGARSSGRSGTRTVLQAGDTSLDLYEAGPVGSEEVEALERSVEVFRDWDASCGGGLQRKAVVGQLNEVGGMLTYRHPEHLERRLWTVAANLAVLAGWMSHDVGLEPTAQRYFVIAVHAAREAGDRPRAGEALSRAARQMVHLGRADDALDLMALAKRTAGEQTLPRTRAMLNTVEAWAQASLGRTRATRRFLGEAEELFVADSGVPAPSWMQFFDEADLHGMQGLVYRTLADHDPGAAVLAQHHARRAMQLRAKKGFERSTIFDRLSLASAHWIAGEPEEAQAQTKGALEAIPNTSSLRTWDRLREMRRLTQRYSSMPEVADLQEQIRLAEPRQRRQTV